MYIRITKEFNFEMAHALLKHDGPCKNIHGHSYLLSVTVKGIPQKDPHSPKNGMVADFSDIKKIIAENIIKHYDHALLLEKNAPKEITEGLKEHRLILTEFQPTCENLLIHFVKTLRPLLPEELQLHHIFLRETNTSYAEWYAEDNEHIES